MLSAALPLIALAASLAPLGVSASPIAANPVADAATPTITSNIFSGKQIYANPYYASEISASAIPSMTGTLATKASAVAKIGTFTWL